MSELPQYNFDEKPSSASKIPLLTLGARVVTLASLLVTWAVLQTSAVTLDNGAKLKYDHYRSHSYAIFVVIAGVAYNVLHIPFAIYFLIRKKRLISHKVFRQFEFYGDKITLCLLATGLGAVFGATLDLLRITYNDNNSKFHQYLNLMYIPSAFFLAGFLSHVVSSVLSSMSLHKSE